MKNLIYFVLIVILATFLAVTDFSLICRLAMLVGIVFLLLHWNKKSITFMFHKIKSIFNKKDSCYFSPLDCPYMDHKLCDKDKSNCHLIPKKKKGKSSSYNTIILIVFGLLSFFLIIFSSIYTSISNENNEVSLKQLFDFATILKILESLSISVLAGAILAWVIDFPSKLKEYKGFFINILSSPEYLKTMDEKQLTNLRQDVTTLLHTKDVPNMPKGLINLDQEICNMLKHPYYKRYRQSIIVESSELTSKSTDASVAEIKFFKKDVTIEYTMFNPYGKEHPVTVDLSFSNLAEKHNNIEYDDLFKIHKFTIIIDPIEKNDKENKEIDLQEYIDIAAINLEEAKYNTKIFLYSKNKGSLEKGALNKTVLNDNSKSVKNAQTKMINTNVSKDMEGVYLNFSDKITVKIHYTIHVPEYDLIFTKRLRYPVKYFQIDYASKIKDMSLYGQLLGTLIDQSKISSDYTPGNDRISLRTYDWLLPRNGAIVVMVHNISKKDEEPIASSD